MLRTPFVWGNAGYARINSSYVGLEPEDFHQITASSQCTVQTKDPPINNTCAKAEIHKRSAVNGIAIAPSGLAVYAGRHMYDEHDSNSVSIRTVQRETERNGLAQPRTLAGRTRLQPPTL
ncbi:hypothetical protein KQX54_008258 [Cotesia glomerata]|uniref:Uncharacterized protein n=1 Tax=Cotesia glomerata TaxID=32391 RepID=A0AAV7HQ95_COTGL|nr:hypothetical protein KQX54_008258 [Cotesia glomerata]